MINLVLAQRQRRDFVGPRSPLTPLSLKGEYPLLLFIHEGLITSCCSENERYSRERRKFEFRIFENFCGELVLASRRLTLNIIAKHNYIF